MRETNRRSRIVFYYVIKKGSLSVLLVENQLYTCVNHVWSDIQPNGTCMYMVGYTTKEGSQMTLEAGGTPTHALAQFQLLHRRLRTPPVYLAHHKRSDGIASQESPTDCLRERSAIHASSIKTPRAAKDGQYLHFPVK